MTHPLLEKYKGRVAASNKRYASLNEGKTLSDEKKMLVAQCLQNTAKFINEAYDRSSGTQRSDMGDYKRFCLDITTVTMPNLIVNDLLMVQPMTSFQGYITYMRYGLGTEKGGVGGLDDDGNYITPIQDPFVWEPMTEARSQYSGAVIVEPAKGDGTKTDFVTLYFPLVDVDHVVVNGVEQVLGTDFTIVNENGEHTIKFATAPAADADIKIGYRYDNQVVPQEAALPTVTAQLKGIELRARARRIAIKYSQFAAFQSKQDYGIDFESSIAQQAQAELQYQIDGEAIFMIKKAADARFVDEAHGLITWVDEELDTISYSMKAEGFARKIEQACAVVYGNNGRFMPTWLLASPAIMPILTFVPGFKRANFKVANGAYKAGDINGIDVIISPSLKEKNNAGRWVFSKDIYLGVLGNDGKSAVGIYAPYMPLVPTMLLGTPDGMLQQGYSTMYDMRMLNENLLGKISVVDGTNPGFAKMQVKSI